jgi:predicted ArsR family transcriptional regulator
MASDNDFAATVTAMSTAFGDPTRRSMYLWAREAGVDGVTAAQAAQQFGIHANVARHHLEKLCAGGYLDVSGERGQPSGAGRPSKRYVAANFDPIPSSSAAATRMDDLLVTLLGRVLGELDPARAATIAEEVGEAYGRTLALSMAPESGSRTMRTALHSIAGALTAHGFAAHTEERGSSIAIIAEQCPFGATAEQHPVICAVDRGMVKGMLGHLYGDVAVSLVAKQTTEPCVTNFN